MIHDRLEHWRTYATLHPAFKDAFEFIEQGRLNTLPSGKHNINGEDLFVIINEYETKDEGECIMENHRKYIDIQFMMQGEECMGTSVFKAQTPTTTYDESKDAAFYPNKYDSLTKVAEQSFTIFFPHDLHMPCIKTGDGVKSVKKAVFKVRVM
jgi:YhcH/YjgK/YiaL family protein